VENAEVAVVSESREETKGGRRGTGREIAKTCWRKIRGGEEEDVAAKGKIEDAEKKADGREGGRTQ